MKYGILGVLFLLLASCSNEENVVVGNRTTMEVERVYDAGDVVRGEVITAKFVVKNTGDYPLVVASAKPSCSCTVSDTPKDPIAPGETGVIKAQIDTDKVGVGLISKNVALTCNTDPSVTQLKIKANVIRK